MRLIFLFQNFLIICLESVFGIEDTPLPVAQFNTKFLIAQQMMAKIAELPVMFHFTFVWRISGGKCKQSIYCN